MAFQRSSQPFMISLPEHYADLLKKATAFTYVQYLYYVLFSTYVPVLCAVQYGPVLCAVQYVPVLCAVQYGPVLCAVQLVRACIMCCSVYDILALACMCMCMNNLIHHFLHTIPTLY